MSKRTKVAVLALASVFGPSAQASVIDTYPSWNGSDNVYPFGVPDTATYGQTFVCPVDNVLTSYTISLQRLSGAAFEYRMYVASWDGNKAAGAPIYASTGVMSPATGNYEAMTFSPNVELTAGNTYVAFLSTNMTPRSADGLARQAVTYFDSYSGGHFVYINNSANASAWSESSWEHFAQGDAAFRAEFASVPEPGTIAALAMGVSTLLRRQKRHTA